MKYMKKILRLICIFSLLIIMYVVPMLASSDVLTLEKTKELALIHSPSIKKAVADSELSELNSERAYLSYNTALGNWTTQSTGPLKDAKDAAKQSYDVANDSYENSKLNIEQIKEKVKYDVENIYLGILNINDSIKNGEDNYLFIRNIIYIERLKYQIGMSTSINVENQVQKAMEAERTLQILYNQKKSLIWQLNREIGRDLDNELNLAPVTFTELNIENIEGTTKKLIDESLAVKQLNQIIENKMEYTD